MVVSRRVWRTGLEPRLRGAARPSTGALELTIVNAGQGYASESRVVLALAGRRLIATASATGFLDTAEKHKLVVTEVPPNTEVVGLLVCFAPDERWHVWTWDGKRHRVPKTRLLRRTPEVFDYKAEWRRLIKDTPLPNEDTLLAFNRRDAATREAAHGSG
jgi:hypothetical protein